MRNCVLWSNVVYEKEIICHELDFETSELDVEVSKSSIWKHTTACARVCFFFNYYLTGSATNYWAQIVTWCVVCICWDTPSEKTGLWQLPIMSSVFTHKPFWERYSIGQTKRFKLLYQCFNNKSISKVYLGKILVFY